MLKAKTGCKAHPAGNGRFRASYHAILASHRNYLSTTEHHRPFLLKDSNRTDVTVAEKMAEKEPDGAASHPQENGARVPRSSFQLSGEGRDVFATPETGEVSTTDGVRVQLSKAALQSKAHSLHGAVAAKRQATTELLFFASVGDIGRMKRICLAWGIDVSDKGFEHWVHVLIPHAAVLRKCNTQILQDASRMRAGSHA